MRVADNTELEGKALFDYLVENEKSIADTKKSEIIKSMPFTVDAQSEFTKKSTTSAKHFNHKNEETEDPNGLNVKVVANTCGWMDSYRDVLIRGAFDETVENDKKRMVHLHDHIYKSIARIGIVKDVTIEDISLSELGVSGMMGNAQALIFHTEIRKEFNDSLFQQYKLRAVNQHSIGFRYEELRMAINDAEYPRQYEAWQEYIGQVINRSEAEERGYFWVVTKVKVYENSAVLFGANELTPTLSTEEGKSEGESSDDKNKNKESDSDEDDPADDNKINNNIYLYQE